MKQLNEVARMQQLAGISEIKINNPQNPFMGKDYITINNQKDSNKLIQILNSGDWTASTITGSKKYNWNSDPFIQNGDFIPFDIWVDRTTGGLMWSMIEDDE